MLCRGADIRMGRGGGGVAVGSECEGVRGRLWGGGSEVREAMEPRCRFVLDRTTSKMAEMGNSSRRWGGWPRLTWTWMSSSKPILRTGYTPADWPVSSPSQYTHQSDTVSEWRCSTTHHHSYRWKWSRSLYPMSSYFSWQWGSRNGTSSDVTLPPMTPQWFKASLRHFESAPENLKLWWPDISMPILISQKERSRIRILQRIWRQRG